MFQAAGTACVKAWRHGEWRVGLLGRSKDGQQQRASRSGVGVGRRKEGAARWWVGAGPGGHVFVWVMKRGWTTHGLWLDRAFVLD